jgi:hypothetical protein
MNIHFSQFDGYKSFDFVEPFDCWNEFITNEFSAIKLEEEEQTWLFNCCVIAEDEDLSENEFLSDFVRKLPFYIIDNQQSHVVFWFLAPELIPFSNNAQTVNYDKIAIALLNTILKSFSEIKTLENVKNFGYFAKRIINAKSKIEERGILEIREEYMLKQEKEFKNKYWL